MNIVVRKSGIFDVVAVTGRIDGLTASALKHAIDHAAEAGARSLVVDCSGVTYLSSAGLRVFMHAYKALSAIGGQVTLLALPSAVRDVFRISGMDNFFPIADDFSALELPAGLQKKQVVVEEFSHNGIRFEHISTGGAKGRLRVIGSSLPLGRAAYGPGDVVTVPQHEVTWGAGLAVLGNDFGDFSDLFGEAVVVNHQFFSFPAVKRPFVDFSGFIAGNPTRLNFLHGFSFSGEIGTVLKFHPSGDHPSLADLLGAVSRFANQPVFGVVILAMSGGICGMHLKKSPVGSNNPGHANILDDRNFADWMNFPVDLEDLHKVVMAEGIAARDPQQLTPGLASLFPPKSNSHLHAVVFENGLLNLEITGFESELDRVMKSFGPEKVVHLLPSSRLQHGFIGIINMEED